MLVASEEIRLVWAARERGIGAGRIRMNADLCRTFFNRKLDSIKYIRKTDNYKALRSRLEVTMAEEREEEGESAPDGETHLHRVMYGSEWDKSLVVNSPRFVKSTLTTVEHLVEVTNTSASVPEGPVGEAPKGVAGSEAGEDGESSQVQSQLMPVDVRFRLNVLVCGQKALYIAPQSIILIMRILTGIATYYMILHLHLLCYTFMLLYFTFFTF